MRRAARIDRNQPEIVEALRKLGATVQLLHTDHDGIPDLLAGYQGRNFGVADIRYESIKPSS